MYRFTNFLIPASNTCSVMRAKNLNKNAVLVLFDLAAFVVNVIFIRHSSRIWFICNQVTKKSVYASRYRLYVYGLYGTCAQIFYTSTSATFWHRYRLRIQHPVTNILYSMILINNGLVVASEYRTSGRIYILYADAGTYCIETLPYKPEN